MPRVSSSFPTPDPAVCRRCAACGGVLRVTPRDRMLCTRCGLVTAWTVHVEDLAGLVEDLQPFSIHELTGSRGIETRTQGRPHPAGPMEDE
jgi:hypothetical protein